MLRQLLGVALCCWSALAWSDVGRIEKALAAGQYAEALDLAQAALAVQPGDSQAHFLRGVTLVMLERAAEAIDIFQTLAQEYPGLPEPGNNLAVIYARQGDFTRAQRVLEDVLKASPEYGPAHENLGDVLMARAAEAYRQAGQLGERSELLARKLRIVEQMDKPAVQLAGAAGSKTNGVIAAMQTWKTAWEAADVQGYLAAYSARFRPDRHDSLEAWKRQRRDRLHQNRNISIELSDLRFSDSGTGAMTVRFAQAYRSDSYRDHVRKQLELVEEAGGWRIIREHVLP